MVANSRPDAHRIFVADRATSVIVNVCVRKLHGATAVEVLARQADGAKLDDIMVLGDKCAPMPRQFKAEKARG